MAKAEYKQKVYTEKERAQAHAKLDHYLDWGFNIIMCGKIIGGAWSYFRLGNLNSIKGAMRRTMKELWEL